jgi:hypothetical protein
MNATHLEEPFALLLVVNITMLLFSSIGILASLLFIVLIIAKRKLHTLPNILTLNSTLSILFLSVDLITIAAYGLSRDLQWRYLHISVTMENLILCHLRGYAAHVFFCSLLCSYVIQTFYRRAGTTFCHRVSLRHKKIYKYAIGLQWTFPVV